LKRVAIVGAGVSGLACAFHLRRADAALEVRIFEADAVAGGTMRTVFEQGYRIEQGPNGFLTNKPDALKLARELGLGDRLLPSSDAARKRFLFSGGRLRPLPESPVSFLSSGLMSWSGRLRVLAEPCARPAPGDRDESVAEFAARRLGREAMEKLIEPMTAGVFAGDPDRLSLTSCFPRIRELESRYGGLVRAMLSLAWQRRRARMSAAPGGVLTSFTGGTQDLIDELSRNLAGDLRWSARVERLAAAGKGFRLTVGGAMYEADAVVLAAPAYAAAVLTRDLDAGLAAELADIPYAPIAVAAVGFDAAAFGRSLPGFGFLVPRLERRRILGALWDSSVFSGRAPEGKVLIRAMVGGARQPELAALPPERISALVREELRELMGVSVKPEFEKVFVHMRGIPQYLVGHSRRLERIEARLRARPGLFLNSNAFRGVSLNDCAKQSKLTAEAVLAFVRMGPK
jgi:oxygen-dependent protoporphyrinogen oxidase